MTINQTNSRTTRTNTARTRKVDVNPVTADGERNIWLRIGSIIGEAIGKFLDFSKWTLQSLWSGVVAAASFVMNFNWNQSDAETNSQIDAAWLRISGLLGQAAGSFLGKVVCGAVPLAGILAINPNMGKAISKEVTEELLEELARELSLVARGVGQNLVNIGALWVFQNIRRFIKGGSDEEFEKKLKKAGYKAEDIQKSMAERNKPFVIRQKIEEKIESIDNKYLREFVQETFEEFGQSCTEAGYILTGAIDNYIAQQNLVAADATIEIEFDANGNPVIKKIENTP